MEVKERLVEKWPASLLLVFRTQRLMAVAVECQMVAMVNIGQEEAAIPFRILSGSTCDNPEILGNEVLPDKVFREKLAAIFAVILCLTTV